MTEDEEEHIEQLRLLAEANGLAHVFNELQLLADNSAIIPMLRKNCEKAVQDAQVKLEEQKNQHEQLVKELHEHHEQEQSKFREELD